MEIDPAEVTERLKGTLSDLLGIASSRRRRIASSPSWSSGTKSGPWEAACTGAR